MRTKPPRQFETTSFQTALANVPDVRGEVLRHIKGLEDDERRALDRSLTTRHAAREMSFQVKNEKTGRYDRFVAVGVNSSVAPMLKSDFDRLVNSTGPLMRLYRRLLQTLYSKLNASRTDLGLDSLPDEEAELALKILRQSIYFEPALVHPNMSGYPFLTIGGFDGAVVDPTRPAPIFFEPNLGTPSGLSNNGQLLEDLLWLHEPLRDLTRGSLPPDDTFRRLRKAVESNADAWTQVAGLSVVISPGIYNGAHPDVAAIARGSGMPLVKSSDLYEDRQGYIRLNAGLKDFDPIVTGIYNRMEELFFLQNDAENIPMISPQYEHNEDLGKRLGVPLRPGAIYDWEYDSKGEIVGVRRDEKGEPKFLQVWDGIGQDPSRPDAPRGNFARAIRNRKLYLSNLGGRVVDDKRLFRILTQYLLPKDENLARPVTGLSPSNLEPYFSNPSDFVVKEPDKSGGQGIYFPRAMPSAQVEELNQRVRARPGDFEIQYVSPIATLESEGGDVPIDLRIFVMMDAEGQVSAGPNSVLVRTGAKGSLYTNTSRGGGYGIGLVLEDGIARRDEGVANENSSETPPWPTVLPVSRFEQIKSVLTRGRELIGCLSDVAAQPAATAEWARCRSLALNLSFDFRQIMDLLNPWDMRSVEKLRNFAHGEARDPSVALQLSRVIGESMIHVAASEPVSDVVRRHGTTPQEARAMDIVDLHLKALPSRAELRRLDQPEISYVFKDGQKARSHKVELAEYVRVDNPEIQAVIDEVRAFGGQVRFLAREDHEETPQGKTTWYTREPAYFWVNLNPKSPSYLMPVIGIDLSSELALAGLYHEREHFRLLRELYFEWRSKGLDHSQAMSIAYNETNTDQMIVAGERRAVNAELKAEIELRNHPYNRLWGVKSYPLHFFDPDFANRMTYPEFEGIRRHLHAHRWHQTPLDSPFLLGTFQQAIEFALDTRSSALAHWRERGANEAKLAPFMNSNVLTMLTKPFGINRLMAGMIEPDFKMWLARACIEMKISEQDCGVSLSLAH